MLKCLNIFLKTKFEGETKKELENLNVKEEII